MLEIWGRYRSLGEFIFTILEQILAANCTISDQKLALLLHLHVSSILKRQPINELSNNKDQLLQKRVAAVGVSAAGLEQLQDYNLGDLTAVRHSI